MECVRLLCLENDDELPSLKSFAARRILRYLDQAAPCWGTDLMVQNFRLHSEIAQTQKDFGKFTNRLVRHKRRARDAINELQYTSRKIIEISDVLDPDLPIESLPRRLHYARTELLALQNLEFSIGIIQRYADLIGI